jgi:hypothetical protein
VIGAGEKRARASATKGPGKDGPAGDRHLRYWAGLKLDILGSQIQRSRAVTMQPGMSISYVARRHGLSPSLVFRWRRLMSEGGKQAIRADEERPSPPHCKSPVPTLSNGATALARSALLRTVLVTSIWLPTSAASSTSGQPMGYRRIAALLKRERRSAGRQPVNAKRIFRLMKKHGLLLQRYSGRRRPGEHDGKIITIRSNIRSMLWSSPAGMARSCVSPSSSTATTARSSPGWQQQLESPAR